MQDERKFTESDTDFEVVGKFSVEKLKPLIKESVSEYLKEHALPQNAQAGDSSGNQFSILDALRDHLADAIKSKKEAILKDVGTRGVNRVLAEMLLDEPLGLDQYKLAQRYLERQRSKNRNSVSENDALASAQEMFDRVVETLIKRTKIDL